MQEVHFMLSQSCHERLTPGNRDAATQNKKTDDIHSCQIRHLLKHIFFRIYFCLCLTIFATHKSLGHLVLLLLSILFSKVC